jgi:TonB family protein
MTLHGFDGPLAEVEPERPPAFRRPSAFTISFLVHALLLLLVMAGPRPSAVEEGGDQAAHPRYFPFYSPKQMTKVRFFDLPERKPETPRSEPFLSDADRRAHGGDPARPRADRPFSPGNDSPAGRPGAAPAQPPAPRPRDSAEAARGNDGEARGKTDPKGAPSLLALKGASSGEGQAKEAASSPRLIAPPGAALSRPSALPPVGGEGSGPSEEGGGFVDEEGISFDTKWFDWGPYAAEMVRRIKRNWRIPDLARVGMKGIVVVRFYILADGSVVEERVVKSSEIPPFDNSSFQAIAGTNPLPPLPKQLGSTREGVTVSFYYNIRPEE